jgi:hypothetical protein
VTQLTWRVDPARPDQKPGCNPLTFVFFFLLKRRHFNFFKNDSDDLVTQSKPKTRALDRAGSENYELKAL